MSYQPPRRYIERTRRRKNKYRLAGRFYILVFFVALVTIGALTIPSLAKDSGAIHQGITIDQIDLEGLTYEQAMQTVRAKIDAQLASMIIYIQYNGQVWQFGAADIGASSNAEELVKQAYGIGRQGGLADKIRAMFGKAKTSLSTVITYDLSLLQKRLEAIRPYTDVAAVNASVTFTGGGEFTVNPHREGVTLDAEATLGQIQRAFETSRQVSVEAVITVSQPEITTAAFDHFGRIVSFVTDFSTSSDARKFNINRSLSQFSNMLVKPGQTISFNEVTGDRSIENGYQNAPVIGENKALVDGPGGGVCQSSTTMYNALLRADVTIVSRNHHSFPISYIDKGLDAVVSYPYLDLKFRNDAQTPIILRTYTTETKVCVEIYGAPLPGGRKIKIISEVVETVPMPSPRIVKDATGEHAQYTDQTVVNIPSREGYRVKVYKIYLQGDQEVDRIFLYEDYYVPVEGESYVGILPRPSDMVSPGAVTTPFINPPPSPSPDEPQQTPSPDPGESPSPAPTAEP